MAAVSALGPFLMLASGCASGGVSPQIAADLSRARAAKVEHRAMRPDTGGLPYVALQFAGQLKENLAACGVAVEIVEAAPLARPAQTPDVTVTYEDDVDLCRGCIRQGMPSSAKATVTVPSGSLVFRSRTEACPSRSCMFADLAQKVADRWCRAARGAP